MISYAQRKSGPGRGFLTLFLKVFAPLLFVLLALAPNVASAESHVDGLADSDQQSLLFFWSAGCSHCAAAKGFMQSLAKERPSLKIEWIEVRKEGEGLKRFAQKVRELGIKKPGVPTFIYGQRYVQGYCKGTTEAEVARILPPSKQTAPISEPSPAAEGDCEPDTSDCPIDLNDVEIEPKPAAEPKQAKLVFYWGYRCPHCEEAKPALEALAKQRPGLRIESIEVQRDADGRSQFIAEMTRLGVEAAGVPTFVVGDRYLVGFDAEQTPQQLRDLLDMPASTGKQPPVALPTVVHLPLVGDIDPTTISLPAFTLVIGLVDGINPCAMWVLLVLLSILVHVRSRARLALFGGTFVVMSGVVYFIFMTAWSLLFQLVGLSRVLTIGLGLVIIVMGLINLKELVWFKQGVSLTISDKAKPGLYRRMRGVARAGSLPAAFLGIVVLAFVVNLIELGCTIGLPAIYTRILSLQPDLSAGQRYAYLALYNVAYVVPLALIVLVYALTLHRITLSERAVKVLKGVSGVLLVSFGLLFVFAPEVLS